MAVQRSTKPVPIEPDERVDYDLDALVVEEEDAPPFRFRWGGKPFEMRLAGALPLSEQLSLEEMSTEDSMRLLMGEDSFSELVDTLGGPDERPLSTARMGELIRQWKRHQGLEPGESRASSRSSGNTARQSRRTSRSGRARRTS